MSDEIKQRIVYVLTRKDKADDDDTDIYVGSTSQSLEKRLSQHKDTAKNFMKRGCSENNRLFVRMNEIGLDNWEVSPLALRTCDIKTIREVERKWIRVLGADLNSYSPITDQKEYKSRYYENNKNAIKKQMAAYYEDNKYTILEYQAAYYENNRKIILQRKT